MSACRKSPAITSGCGVNGTSGGTLANDSYNSSYDNAKEKSWQLRHDYNFAALGVPGLTLKNLNLKWRNSTMRRDYSNNEFDENRVIVSYPISLL